MGVHCDHTIVPARLKFWASWHQSISTYWQPSFSVLPEREATHGCAN